MSVFSFLPFLLFCTDLCVLERDDLFVKQTMCDSCLCSLL